MGSQDRNAKMFHVKSARMFLDRLKSKTAGTFLAGRARVFPDRNAKMSLARSAEMFQSRFQGNNVKMFHPKNVAMFQGNSAAMFLANNASRFLSRSVMLLSHLMEGSKKVKENKKPI